MKTIRNDYCIRMFTGSDTLRPLLNEVNLKDGYLYASNAHMIGKINVDLCVKKYKEIEKFPDCESIISDHVSVNVKKVSVDNMFDDLMKIECCFKLKLIECGECHGEGEVTCYHCDNESECKICRGDGEVNGTELELSGEYDCTIFEKKYKLSYLDIIIKTAIFLDVKEIEISNAKDQGGNIFIVGDFEILLMPLSS